MRLRSDLQLSLNLVAGHRMMASTLSGADSFTHQTRGGDGEYHGGGDARAHVDAMALNMIAGS